MKELAQLFVAAGCGDVRTYIQSGNVVFRAPAAVRATLSARIAETVRERFGHAPLAIFRSAAELRATVAANPYVGRAEAGSLHVVFLARAPAAECVRALDRARSPGDAFTVGGREVYLALGTSMADTKLTNAYFDKALATTSTMRNWRTVLALAALLAP